MARAVETALKAVAITALVLTGGNFLLVGLGAGATGALVLGSPAFFSTLAVTAVGTFIGSLLSKPLSNPTVENFGSKVSNINPIAPRQIVYGQTKVGGTIVYAKSNGTDNAYLNIIVAIAGHEIQSIEKIFINKKEVTATSATEDSTTVFTVTNTDFVNTENSNAFASGRLIKYAFGLGADNQEMNGFTIANTDFTADHDLKGIAYVHFKMTYDQSKLTSLPEINFEIKGKKVYDPRSSSTAWTTNPALIVRDILTDTRFGLKAISSNDTLNEINDNTSALGNFVAAANACEVQVADSSGSNHNKYTANGFFNASTSASESIQGVLSSCAGKVTFTNGQFNVFVGVTQTPSLTITDDDLIKEITITNATSLGKLQNQIKPIFVDASNKFVATDSPIRNTGKDSGGNAVNYLNIDTPTGESTSNYKKEMEVQMPFVTNDSQAQRLGQLSLNYQRRTKIIEVATHLKFLELVPGNWVYVTNSRLDFSAKVFEVLSVNTEAQSGDNPFLFCSLVLKEIDNSVFAFNTGSDYLSSTTGTISDDGVVTISAPTLASDGLAQGNTNDNGTIKSHVDVTWTNATSSSIYQTEIQWRVGGTFGTPTSSAIVEADQTTFRIENAVRGAQYYVRVRHKTISALSSSFSTVRNITIAGDTTAPSVPSSLSASTGLPQAIKVQWTNPSDSDLRSVKVYRKTANSNPTDDTTVVATISGEPSKISTIYNGIDDGLSYGTTYYFWVRAVDFSGNESALSSSVAGNFIRIRDDDFQGVGGGIFFFNQSGNNNAPSDSTFNSQEGRKPRNNDTVISKNTSSNATVAYKYSGQTSASEGGGGSFSSQGQVFGTDVIQTDGVNLANFIDPQDNGGRLRVKKSFQVSGGGNSQRVFMDLAGFDDTGNQVNITGINNTVSNTANGIGIGFFNNTVDKATFSFSPATGTSARFRQQINWSDSSVTSLTFSGRSSSGSLVNIAQFQNDGTSVGATFYGGISVAQGIALSSHTPSSTTNKLYQASGTLFWNGNQVGVGAITSVTNMADNRMITASGSNSLNGEANMTFDGTTLALTGNQTISGNLTVSGTTTTIDTTNLDVKDKNITLNYGSGDTSANANGAGITIQDAVSASTDATILWDSSNDEFDFSHKITTPSIQASGASTIDELTVSNDTNLQGGATLSGALSVTSDTSSFIRNSTDNDLKFTFTTNNSSDFAQLIMDGKDGGSEKFLIAYGSTHSSTPNMLALKSNDSSAGAIGFFTNSQERGRFDVNGRLGLGTTSPDTNLDITASGVNGLIMNQDTGNSVLSSRLFFKDSTRTNAIFNVAGSLDFRTGATIGSSSGTSRMSIDGSGHLDLKTGNYRVNGTTVIDSSRNLTNIGTISSGAITSSGTITSSSASGFVASSTTGTGLTTNNSVYLRVIAPAVESGHTTKHELSMGWSSAYDRTYQAPKIDGTFDFADEFGYNFAEGNWYFESRLKVGALNIGANEVIDNSRNLTNINEISLASELNFTGNGNKIIDVSTKANSNNFKIRHHDPSDNSFETAIQFTAGGGAAINHAGSTKLTTTSTGVAITGTLAATAVTGDGSGLTNIPTVTVNNNADNRLITGSGTANTLNAESTATFTAGRLTLATASGGGQGNQPTLILTDTDATLQQTRLKQVDGVTTLTSQNGSGASGAIKFVGLSGAGSQTSTTYGGFDASGNFEIGTTDVIDASRNVNNLESINMPDSKKIKLGTGSDLQIYHDGTHSYIEETNGSGNLYIRGESIDLRRQANGEQYILAQPNGAVTLFYDGSSKLATTSTGIDVAGSITTDDYRTDGSNVFYLTSASDWRFRKTSGTEHARLTAAGQFLINQTSSNGDILEVTGDANVFAGRLNGSTTGGQSYGLRIRAGTNSTDKGLLIENTGGTDLFAVCGDGTIDIAGTQILDSSRNLTNIGTVASGAITSSGTFTLSGTGTDNDSHMINFVNGACAIARDNNDLELHAYNAMVFGVSNTSYPTSTERMRIDSSGRLGIGTNSPSFELDVEGNIGMSGNLYHNGDHNTYIGFTADTQTFRTGGTDRVTINNTGVGIGTTSPSSKLDLTGSGTTQIEFNNTGQSSTSYVGNDATGLFVGTTTNHPIRMSTNNTEAIRIDTSQRVGIGTSSPSRQLTVQNSGNAVASFVSGTSSLVQLALGDTDDDNYAQILLDNSANKLQIQNGGGGAIGNRGITLDSSERVGIGTSSPATKLEVAGNITLPSDGQIKFRGTNHYPRIFASSNNLLVNVDNGSGTNFTALTIDNGGTTTLKGGTADTSDHTLIVRNSSNTSLFSIRNDGRIDLGGSQIFDISRNMSNIGTISSGNITTSGSSPTNTLQDSDGTNQLSTLAQDGGSFILTARNNTSNGNIIFKGNNGSSVSEYGRFNSSGNFSSEGNVTVGSALKMGSTTVIDSSRNLTNLESIVMPDNKVIKIGTDLDLQLLHDGSNSIIKNVATGNLIIRNAVDDGDIILQSDDGSGGLTNYITLDGSEALTKFGQDAKFNDNKVLKFGDSNDLRIYHNGSHSYIDDTGTGNLYIRANNLRLQKYTGETYISADADGAVGLRYDSVEKLATTSSGVSITGGLTTSGASTIDELTVSNDTNLQGGASFGGDASFGDNNKAKFGAGNDLQIYHDGSNSFIQDAGTGTLRILSDDVRIMNAAGTEISAQFIQDGEARLKYDNVTKLATKSTGIDVTGSTITDGITSDGTVNLSSGNLQIAGTNVILNSREIRNVTALKMNDNNKILLGTSQDLEIYHDSNNSYITDSGTGNLRIGGTQVDILNPDSNEFKARFKTDGAVELYYDNSKKFETVSSGVLIPLGQSYWIGATSDAGDRGRFHASSGNLFIDWGSAGTLSFRSGSNSSANRATLDSSGNFNAIGSYQLNGTTIVDSSRNLTNIGTGSFSDKVTLSGTTDEILTLNSTDNGAIYMSFERGFDRHAYVGFGGSSDAFYIANEESGGSVIITSGNSTALTLNSSQNATFENTVDVKSQSSLLQRWFEGSTEVGRAIGVSSTLMAIGSGDTGVLFNANVNAVYPWQPTTNAGLDNTVDLGISSRKWRDIYFSGNLKVGSTTVIDSSRNLTNIGTISSGNITATRLVSDAGNNYSQVKLSGDNGTNGNSYRFSLNNNNTLLLQRSTDNFAANATLALTIDSSQNATFAGVVTAPNFTSNGDITISEPTPKLRLTDTDTGADSDISGSSSNGSLFLSADTNNEVANTVLAFQVDGATKAYIGTDGLYTQTGSSSSKILDNSTRNLTNIGTISAGVFTTNANTGTFSNSTGTFPLVTSTVYDYTAKFESTDANAFIILEDNSSTNNANRIGVTGNDMKLVTNATTALTLNSSQNATFAGHIFMAQQKTINFGGLAFARMNASGNFELGDIDDDDREVKINGFAGTSQINMGDGSVAITGALSKSSGSFKIDHPLKPDTHHLVHSFVEGPQADNLYRGKVQLENGKAEIDLEDKFEMTSGTFEALNRDIQIFTTNESDWDNVRGSVVGSKLIIECQNTNSTAEVSWLVIGERQDKAIYDSTLTDNDGRIIVEPEKVN